MSSRIVVWGLGRDYGRCLNELKNLEKQNQIEVIGITDQNGLAGQVKYVDEWPVLSVEEIINTQWDYCLVMSEKYYLDIFRRMRELGIDNNKIIPCRVLWIPYFDWGMYIEAREAKLSIVCNNCWGGLLSYTLGMEHRSPFKNLALSDTDLIKMLYGGLQKYMSSDLQLVRWQVDIHSKRRYPVMRLRDVEIHFNHDDTVKHALEEWNRRKHKIDYEKLLVGIYTEKEEVVNDFLNFHGCVRKICFVPYELYRDEWKTTDCVYPLSYRGGQNEFYLPVNESATVSGINYKLLPMYLGRIERRLG